MYYDKRSDAFARVLSIVRASLDRFAREGFGKVEITVSRRSAKALSILVTSARIQKFDAPTADAPAASGPPSDDSDAGKEAM